MWTESLHLHPSHLKSSMCFLVTERNSFEPSMRRMTTYLPLGATRFPYFDNLYKAGSKINWTIHKSKNFVSWRIGFIRIDRNRTLQSTVNSNASRLPLHLCPFLVSIFALSSVAGLSRGVSKLLYDLGYSPNTIEHGTRPYGPILSFMALTASCSSKDFSPVG